MNQLEEISTFSGYLGDDFQLKVLWQLVTDDKFAEKNLPNIDIDYFDMDEHKRFFSILFQYFDFYNKPANIYNKTLGMAIKKFANKRDKIEYELITELGLKIKEWDDKILNKEISYDGDIVQNEVLTFIKQQEYRKLADFINGSIKKRKSTDQTDNEIVYSIEDKIKRISEIGIDEDDAEDIFDNLDDTLSKESRKTIPTGIAGLDAVTKNGLGNGEMGIVLAPSGVGKSTILTKIANNAFAIGKNVLHIVFEDTKTQIKRKHLAIMSGVRLSEFNENQKLIKERVKEWKQNNDYGILRIKRMSQENTTIPMIRQYIENYKKKNGVKFDILILDYIDCVEPHKKSQDQNSNELIVIKAFESMCNELDIPCWTAIQTNRCLDLATKVDIEGKGIIELKDVEVNDKILTHKGYKAITKVFPIKKQKRFKIKLKSGKEIICSHKHQFPTSNNQLLSIETGLKVGIGLLTKGDHILPIDNIISIEELEEGDTIDITVDDTHMFYANDIYTHNSGFNSKTVGTDQMGGNIKRAQKTHLLMSVSKDDAQKLYGLATIRILKARMAKDGFTFEDCTFDNDSMEIIIPEDKIPTYTKKMLQQERVVDSDLDDLNQQFTGYTNTNKSTQNEITIEDVNIVDEVEDNSITDEHKRRAKEIDDLLNS